jgi:flagellar biosynthesis chaperone FliJ
VARFVFELEAVLEMRRRAEREKQRAVGELVTRRAALEGRAIELQRGVASSRGDLRAMLDPAAGAGMSGVAVGVAGVSGGVIVRVEHVRMQAASALHADLVLRRLALEVAGVDQRLLEARRELLKAAVARKAVEKLREKRLEAWRSEQNRREAAAIDDLAVMRAGARAAQGATGAGDGFTTGGES